VVQTPRDWCYRNFTHRRSDLDWTINQVRFAVAPGREQGSLMIEMGTSTPHSQTFLVSADGSSWEPSSHTFAWALHPGANQLEMRVRNTSGIEGPVSSISLEYTAEKK